jgi:hypothetical protein
LPGHLFGLKSVYFGISILQGCFFLLHRGLQIADLGAESLFQLFAGGLFFLKASWHLECPNLSEFVNIKIVI